MEQLILHLIGDYVTQSDWMASNKTTSYVPAAVHATVYSLPFLLLRPSWTAFAIILITHFFIDRFRLAKYVVWAKNLIGPREHKQTIFVGETSGRTVVYDEYFISERYRWDNCKATGYPSETPVWLATWLMIIADNTMHLTINFLALKYL